MPEDAEVRRGATITQGVAISLIVPQVVMGVVLAMTRSEMLNGFWFFFFVVQAVLSWCLFKGYEAARWYVVMGCGAVAFQAFWGIFRGPVVVRALFFAISALNAGAALTLWKSSAVEAFFVRQTRRREGFPSMREHGGA